MRTSQILNEVLQLHLPLRLHIGAVHVRVKEDDGKCQDKNGVWVLELSDQHWVTNTVALTTERQRKNTMNIVNWTQRQNPFSGLNPGVVYHLKASTSRSTR